MAILHSYFETAITSIIGSVILWFTLFVLNDKIISPHILVIVLIASIIISYYTSIIISNNYKELIVEAEYRFWLTIFIHTNVFIGISIGIISGVIFAWLLLYPFSFIFGHPEESRWSLSVTNAFGLIMLISVIISMLLSVRYFFNSCINYIKRRARQSEQ